MWEFILAAGNVPFVAALVLMLLIGVVEALGLGAGLAVGEGIDGLDGDVNVETPSLLSWINVGRLPLLMLIVVFLFAFGMTGLIGQRLFAAFLGQPAPWFMAAPAALIIALPVTRVFGRVVSRIMPRDETQAVSRDSLIGRVATIVTGEARHESAAQARVRDEHGQAHYVMVEPDTPTDAFAQGSNVLLVRHVGARYYAIRTTSASLLDSAS
ncbi:YqiJ family protein [Brevundimonas sp. BAL450]|jgi:membrane protein implicated in regulation of membrane protease activity|uniref:Putative inner membrane protein n=1 Tax=Brevundimonas abyssalis TAR-001 TaxID=1391729 RepID=A0A8E0TSU3_9CAUL|nr:MULTISPECIES: YqiJ family protein [Brevundimonas]MBG7616080.1 YqiJ family protein [Brevundimonas sp. BAL450]GAD60625.1 putative inner membrane protein [Brevundimonas abyssalis TAR-001]